MRDPEVLIQLSAKLHKPRERYLKFRQVEERYDRGKHSKLAEIIIRIRKEEGSPTSMAALETAAYGDPEYIKYLIEWDNASKEKVKAQVEFDNLNNDFQAYQSALSFDRETIKNHGG